MRKPSEIKLTAEVSAALHDMEYGINEKLRKRAMIIRLAAEGLSNIEISHLVRISVQKVGKWRKSFAENGLEGLKDEPRQGRPKVYTQDDIITIVKALIKQSNWSVPGLQRELNEKHQINISVPTLQRILADLGLKPKALGEWVDSRDSEFTPTTIQLGGIHVNARFKACILCTDSIHQAEAALGKSLDSIDPPDLEWDIQETQSLLLALVVNEEMGSPFTKVDTEEQFIELMKRIMKYRPNKEYRVILSGHDFENLNKISTWLEKHKDSIQIKPSTTIDIWQDHVESWLEILTRKVIDRGILTSKDEVVRKTMAYIRQYIEEARSFCWMHKG
jgi:transposase